jgi:Transcriptional regulator
MPPKTKIQKEDIIRAAFEITNERGIEAATAKAIAKKLNCSIQPIYWIFDNMNNLRRAIIDESTKEYNNYLLTEIPGLNKYKAAGWNYIRFAKEKPHLFRLLFMTDRQENTNIAESTLDENKAYIISAIKELYGLSDADANGLYVELWIFSHGIATMAATKTVKLSDKDISRMLTNVLTGLLKNYKEERQ